MPTVLLSAPYMLPFVERFRPVFQHYGLDLLIPQVKERMEEEQILAYAGKFDGTICGDDRYSAEVIKKCLPRLKVISKWGTGIDSINKEFAESVGVMVKNTPNAFTLPVSDSVMAYILAFARKQPWMDKAMKKGVWEKISGRSLSECALAVIGVGNIGKAVLRRAKGFGMHLLGNDIQPIAPDFILENYVEMLPFEQALAQADFISLNCDLNPTSYHIINAHSLAFVKTSAILINTARGQLVDESALITALEEERLGGAALDVFEVEPLPVDSPLREMENVMLAPHNSNSSPSAWERVHWSSIHNLLLGLQIDHADLEEIQHKITSN